MHDQSHDRWELMQYSELESKLSALCEIHYRLPYCALLLRNFCCILITVPSEAEET